MCGRYSLTTPLEGVQRLFGIDELPNLAARYNIAPTQPVVVIRNGEAGRRELTHMRWGLVPSWAKDVNSGPLLINARADSIAEKPSFRNSFRRRRCLVPADGFYEWQAQPKGPKIPMRIALPADALFAFAGIWERWQSAEGSELESCAIVTTEASPAIAHIHSRMPVILKPETYETWLSAEPKEAGTLMHAYEGELVAYPISRDVNSVRNDNAALWQPAEPPGPPDPPAAGEQLDLL
jgi:putative SOS response-associated peptidase YedK